ncbi:unnamed protein product [Durusdinium trenchii]|uniref:Uncharacterized protein n=2 Tax=Durusdinium trenchii TaxID=1381693 RepID=A0ABP0INX5_9DINO
MGHWMLSKALALRHETLAQLQGGDADELQSNASYTGSNVTQCPEAWAEVQGWQDNDVRLLIPYLDAKVSHPLSIEAEPIAVEPVTMEPITFEVNHQERERVLSTRPVPAVQPGSSTTSSRAIRPPSPRPPAVFGIGTRPPTPREGRRSDREGRKPWEVQEDEQVAFETAEERRPDPDHWEKTRQRAGIPSEGKKSEEKEVQTHCKPLPGLIVLTRAANTLFWCLAAWRQAVSFLRLQRSLVSKHSELEEALQLGRQLSTFSQSEEATCRELREELRSAREAATTARERDVELQQMQVQVQQMQGMQHSFYHQEGQEMRLLRKELEHTKMCEAENAQAECAILRAVREEIAVKRQKDHDLFRNELQAEQEASEALRQTLKSLSADAEATSRPRKNGASLRKILKLHSDLPEADSQHLVSLASEEATQMRQKALEAENRCNALSDELHVQDIICRRLRLDEGHFELEENQLAEQRLAERQALERNEIHTERMAHELQEELRQSLRQQHELQETHAAHAKKLAEMAEAERQSAASKLYQVEFQAHEMRRRHEQAEEAWSRHVQEGKIGARVWAGRVAKELERIQQTKLLRACVLEWWRELSLKGDFAEKGLTRELLSPPSAVSANAADEALRRAEARCEISRLRSQALEAELAAALEDTQDESDEARTPHTTPLWSERAEESIPPSRWDPRQADLQIRQLSHWAFDGLFFLMRSVFVTWRDQQKTQKHLVQAFSSSSTFLVTSLTTLCCRALFAVWLQATLASKGRLQYMQTRHLRPGILRRANRRTQGALRLLERLWLLRFAFSLWSTVAIAPSATGLQAPHRGASAP